MAEAKRGVVRTYLLPMLLLFALPALGWWFASHATGKHDQLYREAALAAVESDPGLNAAERAETRAFYENVPASRVCAEAPLESLNEGFRKACSTYDQFAAARWAALGSVGLGLVSLLLLLGCSAVSFVSRPAQYASFIVGWNFLRVASAVQTLVQGGLIVWLSYWMTALWLEVYVVKLILLAGALAAFACYHVVRAIFRKVDSPLLVEGELLDDWRAPELWRRVRELAQRLGTAPPHQIITGIDDNFFVTEGEVQLDNRRFSGRTLFVSLSLLKAMERSEADAVLAHELAHFSGGDTAHSKKLAPGLTKFAAYLQALQQGFITLPIYFFMLAFWAMFQLSLSRSSREREFRADAVAARHTSPDDVARSLVKVAAYSSYRRRVEEGLFQRDRVHSELGIAERIASGFHEYSRSEHLHGDLVDSRFPHPFDSHPSIEARLAAVRSQVNPSSFEAVLVQPRASCWLDTIRDAQEIERRLWDAYERRFAAIHELSLTYRYLPATPEERAIVEKHFPRVSIEGCKDGPLVLDCESLTLEGSGVTIELDSVASVSVGERFFKKYFDLKMVRGADPKKFSICINDLRMDKQQFVDLFGRYYGRRRTAVQTSGSAWG